MEAQEGQQPLRLLNGKITPSLESKLVSDARAII